jgi:hypothetical protein
MPPKAIADLVDAPGTPGVSVSPNKKHILILERASLPSIEELSQPELRLAGLRINPATNGRSRTRYYTGIIIQNLDSGTKTREGAPQKWPHFECQLVTQRKTHCHDRDPWRPD